MPPWFLGLGCFITMTLLAFAMLIIVRLPDPNTYRDSVAFVALACVKRSGEVYDGGL